MQYDPFVLDARAVLLQRVADCVGRGYPLWCGGEVPLDRAARLAQKLDIAYGVGDDRHQRQRKKRIGCGVAVALWWRPSPAEMTLKWWLFVSRDGAHTARSAERLLDATTRQGRIRIDSLELVRQAVPSSSADRSVQVTRNRMTWRFAEDAYQNWRDTLRGLVRRKAPAHVIRDRFHALFSTPGFAPARSQIGKLVALYRAEWGRCRGNESIISPPRKLGYVRRLSTTGEPLSRLTNSAVAHRSRGIK